MGRRKSEEQLVRFNLLVPQKTKDNAVALKEKGTNSMVAVVNKAIQKAYDDKFNPMPNQES